MPEENRNNNGYLPVRIFTPLYILIFTIILAMVGWFAMAINGQNNVIDKNRDEISEVKGDIKSINTNVANIYKAIDNINENLKKR